ncbi:LysR family transcriptional regulator [uncultured Pseudomonas sp.]|uniref:LysR family transcriptional regulator n=1 Tax=uncultured Pseudomonas sp. TaxID=114707 RepID=UPI0025FD5574|nr:LysR family transcriptional regulator [uncultured Pseudomonas sp.]
MRLNLRQLQIFCAIHDTGSTTAAAALVALSQSATSAALNELEQSLETRLFDRVGKRLVLNDNGRALLPQARQMLDMARHIESDLRPAAASPRRYLRIGASSTIGNYVLPRLVRRLRDAMPNLRLEVRIGNSREIASLVAGFQLDAGLIEAPCHEAQLNAEPWLVDELLLVAGADHPLAQQAEVGLGALSRTEWLLREPGSGTREEVEHLLLRHLHDLGEMHEVGSSEAIKNTLVQGIGVSCLSRWVVGDMLDDGRLRVLSTELPPLTRRFFMLRHQDKFVSAALESFWRLCQGFAH